MKHFADLDDKQRDALVDAVGDDVQKLFVTLKEKHNICPTCMHEIVMLMCENVLNDLMGESNGGTKH